MIKPDKQCRLEFINGIMHAHYKEDAYIDLALAKDIVERRKVLANNRPHPVVVTGGPIEVSPEARKFAFSPQSSELISAWALVTE